MGRTSMRRSVRVRGVGAAGPPSRATPHSFDTWPVRGRPARPRQVVWRFDGCRLLRTIVPHMASISGIASVEARIAGIQSRLGSPSSSRATGVNGPLTTQLAGPVDPTAGFDPFGAAYQAALDAAGIVGVADPGAAGDSIASAGPASSPTAPNTPTIAPGDGTVATFTPAEFAVLDSTAVSTTSDTSTVPRSIGGAGTGAPAPASWSQAGATSLAPHSATAPHSPTPSYGATPSYGTTSSVVVDSKVLDGPVYTGAASRAASASVSAPRSTSAGRYAGFAGAGSSVGTIGGFGAMPVAPELRAHGNGQIPASALEPIGQRGHRLHAPAAEAWTSAVAAARAEGIELRVTDTYRTYDQQVDLVARKGLYSNGGYAAVPGTSNHGWGLAVDADVRDPATLAWLRSNAHRFGFVEAVPREPWHWEFRPSQA